MSHGLHVGDELVVSVEPRGTWDLVEPDSMYLESEFANAYDMTFYSSQESTGEPYQDFNLYESISSEEYFPLFDGDVSFESVFLAPGIAYESSQDSVIQNAPTVLSTFPPSSPSPSSASRVYPNSPNSPSTPNNPQSHICNVCNGTFASKYNLGRHRKHQHPGTPLMVPPRSPPLISQSLSYMPAAYTYPMTPSPEFGDATFGAPYSAPQIVIDQRETTYDCPVPDCHRKGADGFSRKDNMTQHQRLVHRVPIIKRERASRRPRNNGTVPNPAPRTRRRSRGNRGSQ